MGNIPLCWKLELVSPAVRDFFLHFLAANAFTTFIAKSQHNAIGIEVDEHLRAFLVMQCVHWGIGRIPDVSLNWLFLFKHYSSNLIVAIVCGYGDLFKT